MGINFRRGCLGNSVYAWGTQRDGRLGGEALNYQYSETLKSESSSASDSAKHKPIYIIIADRYADLVTRMLKTNCTQVRTQRSNFCSIPLCTL